MAEPRNSRSTIQGVVVSDKMDKTITVQVERVRKHPMYKKYVRLHSKFHAHDEAGEAHVGDTVELMACRPLSKLKRWRLLRVVTKSTMPTGGPV